MTSFSIAFSFQRAHAPEPKKADVLEQFEMFHHAGLLFNKPPGRAGLSFS